jgi:cardiolipin synthase
MLHAKLLVVDDVATIGTANFDNRSFRLNFEVMAVLYAKARADELAERFEVDLAHAKQVKRRALHEQRPLVRFAESAARLASPLL